MEEGARSYTLEERGVEKATQSWMKGSNLAPPVWIWGLPPWRAGSLFLRAEDVLGEPGYSAQGFDRKCLAGLPFSPRACRVFTPGPLGSKSLGNPGAHSVSGLLRAPFLLPESLCPASRNLGALCPGCGLCSVPLSSSLHSSWRAPQRSQTLKNLLLLFLGGKGLKV